MVTDATAIFTKRRVDETGKPWAPVTVVPPRLLSIAWIDGNTRSKERIDDGNILDEALPGFQRLPAVGGHYG